MMDSEQAGRVRQSSRRLRWVLTAAAAMLLCVVFIGLIELHPDFKFAFKDRTGTSGTATSAASVSEPLVTPDEARIDSARGEANQPPSGVAEHAEPEVEFVESMQTAIDEIRGGSETPAGPATRESAPRLLRSIQGWVLDDAGMPLPDIEISAMPAAAENAGNASGMHRTMSDELGFYAFDGLADSEYRLIVRESEKFRAGALRARAGSDAANIHLQRKDEIRVTGRVHDDGEPLAEVQVRPLGNQHRARSDAAGEFEIALERQKVGTLPVLEFSLAGFRTARERVPPPTPDARSPIILNIELEPLGELVTFLGTVQDNRGEPVAGSRVLLSSQTRNFHRRVTTGPYGTFSFDAIESGGGYRVAVEPANFEYRRFISESMLIDAANNALDIVLEDGGLASLSGTITTPGGRPLQDFVLWVRNTESSGRASVAIRTDARGRFEPVRINAGPIKLESRSIPRLETTGIALSAGESRHVEVAVDWGEKWLLGRVVDEQGQPVARASVSAHWTQNFGDGRSLSSRQARSDLAGYFSFSNLGGRQYRLTCSAPGFAATQINAAPDGESDIVIRLRRPSTGGP